MAQYTLQNAIDLQGLSKDVRDYLKTLANSYLPNAKNKTFSAQNKTELKEKVEEAFAYYQKQKEKKQKPKDCHKIVDELLRIVSADDLLIKLQDLKQQVKIESNKEKIEKFITKSGFTKTELMEYLSKE